MYTHAKHSCPSARKTKVEPASIETQLQAQAQELQRLRDRDVLFDKLQAEVSALRSQPVVVPAPPAAPPIPVEDHSTTNNVKAETINVQIVHPPPAHPFVHNFGEEDTRHLKDVLGAILDAMPHGTPGKAVIASAVRAVYSDPTYPQNMTVHIPNKRDNVPHIRTPTGWEPRTEAELYPRMVDRACDELQQKQDFELGTTPEGLRQLETRSALVSAAFKDEPEAKHLKNSAALIRPALYSNKTHVRELE